MADSLDDIDFSKPEKVEITSESKKTFKRKADGDVSSAFAQPKTLKSVDTNVIEKAPVKGVFDHEIISSFFITFKQTLFTNKKTCRFITITVRNSNCTENYYQNYNTITQYCQTSQF